MVIPRLHRQASPFFVGYHETPKKMVPKGASLDESGINIRLLLGHGGWVICFLC